MILTIEHLGGATKHIEFEGFDAPRPWIRGRYPNGGGVYRFALAHGGIEHKRGEHPEWFILEGELETLREQARELKIKFSSKPRVKYQQLKPTKPRAKAPPKQAELFAK